MTGAPFVGDRRMGLGRSCSFSKDFDSNFQVLYLGTTCHALHVVVMKIPSTRPSHRDSIPRTHPASKSNWPFLL